VRAPLVAARSELGQAFAAVRRVAVELPVDFFQLEPAVEPLEQAQSLRRAIAASHVRELIAHERSEPSGER
jgi:hypothetical protein